MKVIASIINCFDQEDGDALTNSLKGSLSEEALTSINQSIFRFEDIAILEAASCVQLCNSVEQSVLTTALIGADPTISEALLSTFSPRARRMIVSELESGSNLSDDEVKDARLSLSQSVLRLASEGQITLPDRT